MLCAFHGRFQCIRRIIRFYLDQDYEGKSYLVLFNNSSAVLRLGDFHIPENKTIILINRDKSKQTGKGYTNLGEVYTDAVSEVPTESDVIAITDSDDFYLPNHLSIGCAGIKGFLAYKPYYSYFYYGRQIELANNNMEPSIFVNKDYISREGFNTKAFEVHTKWLGKLFRENKIYVAHGATPTMIYNWGEGHGNHKISGLGDRDDNFTLHREAEQDFGDGEPLTPIDSGDKYYSLINKLHGAL